MELCCHSAIYIHHGVPSLLLWGHRRTDFDVVKSVPGSMRKGEKNTSTADDKKNFPLGQLTTRRLPRKISSCSIGTTCSIIRKSLRFQWEILPFLHRTHVSLYSRRKNILGPTHVRPLQRTTWLVNLPPRTDPS